MALKFTENLARAAGLQLRSNDARAKLRAVVNASALIAAIGPAGPSAITAYAAGNTTQNSSTTMAGSSVIIDGLGGVSVGFSNGSIQISGATGGGTGGADGVNIVSASGNTSGTLTSFSTGTIVLAGGNNITLSQSSNTITISGASIPAQTNQSLGLYGIGQTTGQSSSSTVDARSLSFDGAGAVSVGMSGGSVVISAPNTIAQTNQSEGFYAIGNTTGQSSSTTLDARTISIDGAGGVSVGYSGGSVVISGPQTVAQTNQSIGVYASSQTTGQSSSSTVDARSFTHVGQGAVSVGLSGGSLLISAPNTIAQTVQSVGVYASSQTVGESSSSTVDARSFTHVGKGAVSVGMSGGSLLISAPNTIAQTNQTDGVYLSQNTTGNSSSLTYDARSLTIEGLGAVSVGWSTNNSHLLISAPNTIAQTNQSIGIYASDNTTAQSSSSTVDARSLTIDLKGIISGGMSAGSLVLSVPAGGGQTNQTIGAYAVGNTTGQSSSTTLDARTVSFDFVGGNSGGFSGGSVVVSGGAGAAQTNQTLGIYAGINTIGTTSSTYDARSLTVDGHGIISVGWESVGGGTHFGISAPAERSFFSNGMPYLGNDTVPTDAAPVLAMANTIVSVAPFRIDYPVVFSQFVNPIWFSGVTSANTSSRGIMISMTHGIYTRNASSISAYITTSGTMSTFYQNNSTSSNFGNRLISATIAQTTLTPGEYWYLLYVSTATSVASAANTIVIRPVRYGAEHNDTNAGAMLGYGTGATGTNATGNPIFLPFGSGIGSSYGFQWNLGRGSGTHGGSFVSRALTDISVSGSNYSLVEPCFILRNWSIY